MNIAPIAEEVKEPQRNLPLALLGGVLVVVVLYLGATSPTTTHPPGGDGRAEEHPGGDGVGQRLIGPVGVMFVSAVIMCSVLGSLNGNVLVGPRLLFAMGEDGWPWPGWAGWPRGPDAGRGDRGAGRVVVLLVVGVGALTRTTFRC